MAADEGRNTPHHGRNEYGVMAQCRGEVGGKGRGGLEWASLGIAGHRWDFLWEREGRKTA